MLENGNMDNGTLAAGQSMGLVRDIPTCKVLLDRIMDEAESIIKEKFSQVICPKSISLILKRRNSINRRPLPYKRPAISLC